MSSLASPPKFDIAERSGNRVTLKSAGGHIAQLFVLEDDIVRVMVLPSGKPSFPRTWAIAPNEEDVPTEGRDRFDTAGFANPSFELQATDKTLAIQTRHLRLTVQLAGFFCQWEINCEGEWRRALTDRVTQAYNFGWWDDHIYHYLARDPGEMYFGLGERSGEMNRAGRRFRMSNMDAMGYNARTSDPLYKHIPFYITWRPRERVAFGLFYDTASDCSFDFGCERSNYHGLYRSFAAEHGDLDLYFVGGPRI